MSVSEMRMHSALDPRALQDVVQSSCTEAVVVSDLSQLLHALRRMFPAESA
jgi:hypothetical protein